MSDVADAACNLAAGLKNIHDDGKLYQPDDRADRGDDVRRGHYQKDGGHHKCY